MGIDEVADELLVVVPNTPILAQNYENYGDTNCCSEPRGVAYNQFCVTIGRRLFQACQALVETYLIWRDAPIVSSIFLLSSAEQY